MRSKLSDITEFKTESKLFEAISLNEESKELAKKIISYADKKTDYKTIVNYISDALESSNLSFIYTDKQPMELRVMVSEDLRNDSSRLDTSDAMAFFETEELAKKNVDILINNRAWELTK